MKYTCIYKNLLKPHKILISLTEREFDLQITTQTKVMADQLKIEMKKAGKVLSDYKDY